MLDEVRQTFERLLGVEAGENLPQGLLRDYAKFKKRTDTCVPGGTPPVWILALLTLPHERERKKAGDQEVSVVKAESPAPSSEPAASTDWNKVPAETPVTVVFGGTEVSGTFLGVGRKKQLRVKLPDDTKSFRHVSPEEVINHG